MNTLLVEDTNNVETHKPEDFLLELEELDNDWKTQQSAEHVMRESDNEFEGEAVQI